MSSDHNSSDHIYQESKEKSWSRPSAVSRRNCPSHNGDGTGCPFLVSRKEMKQVGDAACGTGAAKCDFYIGFNYSLLIFYKNYDIIFIES